MEILAIHFWQTQKRVLRILSGFSLRSHNAWLENLCTIWIHHDVLYYVYSECSDLRYVKKYEIQFISLLPYDTALETVKSNEVIVLLR
jgi:hypothetical protein